MRAILVGPAGARNRLCWELEALSIQVIGEFDTMAEARRSGLDADIIVTPPDDSPASEDGRADARGGVFEEALTHRELEVLELLAEGLANKGIAERLGISDQTVKFHVASLYGKLGAVNRTDAVRLAVRRGLIA